MKSQRSLSLYQAANPLMANSFTLLGEGCEFEYQSVGLAFSHFITNSKSTALSQNFSWSIASVPKFLELCSLLSPESEETTPEPVIISNQEPRLPNTSGLES
ncbi:unnamed protein product [Brassica rapa subsp. narinosa]